MKIFKLSSLFILIYCLISNSASADSLVAEAINGILRDYFAKETWTVEVISFGESESEELVENVLRLNNDVVVRVIKYVALQKVNLDNPSILFFDTIESYVEWRGSVEAQTNTMARRKHLVYIKDSTFKDIEKIPLGFEDDAIDFLTHNGEKSIELVTSFMFSPSKCKTNQLVVINRFKSSTKAWDTLTFYPEKYKNLHGCKLNIIAVTYFAFQPYEEMFNIFGETLNFTPWWVDNFERQINASLWDLIAKVDNVNGDNIIVGGFPILSEEFKMIVPPGELYAQLDKMFMPFYFEAWVAIFVTLFVSLGVIRLINRCSEHIRNAFFDGNNTPTLNVASIFLCGAQTRMPQRSPARFILMMFVIWCLIIRTCYQSELFKRLQSDERKPGLKSVAETSEKNFTFHGLQNAYNLISMYMREHGTAEIDWKERHPPRGSYDYDIVAEPANKAVMLVSPKAYKGVLRATIRNGVPSMVLLDETIHTVHRGFMYFRYIPYMFAIESNVRRLLEAGITTRWLEQFFAAGHLEYVRRPEEIGPQVLTMEHLDIGFKFWLVPLAFSVFAFVIEVANRPCLKLIRYIRNALVARSALRAFVKVSRKNVLRRTRARKAWGAVRGRKCKAAKRPTELKTVGHCKVPASREGRPNFFLDPPLTIEISRPEPDPGPAAKSVLSDPQAANQNSKCRDPFGDPVDLESETLPRNRLSIQLSLCQM